MSWGQKRGCLWARFSRTFILSLMALLLALAVCSGCGKSSETSNKIGFEINEPMYIIVEGKVMKVGQGKPIAWALVEVKDSKEPAGIKDNPYKGKKIRSGTQLTIDWGVAPSPQVGKTYVLPVEVLKIGPTIKITMKGTPQEKSSSQT